MATLAARQQGAIAHHQLRALGIGAGGIRHRVRAGRLHVIHRGVYAVGHVRLTLRGRWMAAVLAAGEGALLSHRSAGALWGLFASAATGPGAPDVTAGRGHCRRRTLTLHRARLDPEDRAVRVGIPVTSIARTLFDLAEVVHADRLERAFEEADRLGLLDLHAVQRVCDRNHGRQALRAVRPLLASLRPAPDTRSELERRFIAFCRDHGVPQPAMNVMVAGLLVDALWPHARVVVELDGFAFHHHRAAFERDRARDAALQVAGYRVLRLTYRRLAGEPAAVAAEIRLLLTRRA